MPALALIVEIPQPGPALLHVAALVAVAAVAAAGGDFSVAELDKLLEIVVFARARDAPCSAPASGAMGPLVALVDTLELGRPTAIC